MLTVVTAVLSLVAFGAPASADEYLLVGLDTPGGGILRYNATTGAYVDQFVSGALLNNGVRGFVLGTDGNLYVSSQSDDIIREYSGTTGAFIQNFAGNSTGASFRGDLILGPDNNLYAAGGEDNVVYRYNGTTGANLPSPGSSGATFTQGGLLSLATGEAFGPDGNLYVSSYFNSTVQRFNASTGQYIDTFVGSNLSNPTGMTLHNGDLYVANAGGNDVVRIDGTTGAYLGVFASTDLSYPSRLTFGPDGNLYVASYGNNSIIGFDGTTGAYLDTFASGGNLQSPTDLVFYSTASVPEIGTASIALLGLIPIGLLAHRRRVRCSS
jgi:WD40 repeat protein